MKNKKVVVAILESTTKHGAIEDKMQSSVINNE